MSDAKSDPIQASFTLMVWARERNCVVCGNPGANAHHVLYGSWAGRRENVLPNGVMLCGSGTTGCHGKMHGNGNTEVATAIGEYIRDHRPDTLSYLATKLGANPAVDYMRRRYYTEVKMDAPQEPLGNTEAPQAPLEGPDEPQEPVGQPEPGTVNAAFVVVYEDAAGEYRWKAMDTNNKTVADSGEGYGSRSYAEKAVTDLFPFAIIRTEADED